MDNHGFSTSDRDDKKSKPGSKTKEGMAAAAAEKSRVKALQEKGKGRNVPVQMGGNDSGNKGRNSATAIDSSNARDLNDWRKPKYKESSDNDLIKIRRPRGDNLSDGTDTFSDSPNVGPYSGAKKEGRSLNVQNAIDASKKNIPKPMSKGGAVKKKFPWGSLMSKKGK